MLGMEIVDPTAERDALGHPPADSQRARALHQACLKHGLILELGGRFGATVRFLPPLIITEAEVDYVAEILYRSMQEVVIAGMI